MSRLSFREQVLRVREDAIVDAVNHLLADKGFDLMTVDQVASEVGIAKASLYKHFASKEALAAAALVRLLQHTQAMIDLQAADADSSPCERLRAVTRWALERQVAGEMPLLPSQNSSLTAELMANRAYLDLLMQVSEVLGSWIVAAQSDGDIDPALPPELVLYTLYARGCDPVPAVLKAGGLYTDPQIVDWVMGTCFNGLAARPKASATP
ncbi:MAG: helix-turn-helix domain-containing protein [Rubrivivax sp.]